MNKGGRGEMKDYKYKEETLIDTQENYVFLKMFVVTGSYGSQSIEKSIVFAENILEAKKIVEKQKWFEDYKWVDDADADGREWSESASIEEVLPEKGVIYTGFYCC
jgi:DNA modification methylase